MIPLMIIWISVKLKCADDVCLPMGFKMGFRLVSINARGLCDVRKFQLVVVNAMGANIICLQETGWEEASVGKCAPLWDGNIYFSNGRGKVGSGVAILVKGELCESERVIFRDDLGTGMAVELVKDGNKVVIFNIHAPNDHREKRDFFKGVGQVMMGRTDVLLIGDFNVVLTPLDVGSSNVFKADVGRDELRVLMRDFALVDVWRERNGDSRVFSRRQSVQGCLKQSRIDMVLFHQSLVGWVRRVGYKVAGFSDHDYLEVVVDPGVVLRGPGTWVLNSEILRDPGYCADVRDLIEWSLEGGLYGEDVRIWWDTLKFDLKELSMEYSKRAQRFKHQQENRVRASLATELRALNEGRGDFSVAKVLDLED